MRFPLALSLALAMLASPAISAESPTPAPHPLIIGTGAVSGIYFPTAGAVQRLVNDANQGVQLAIESTNGSVSNLESLAAGRLDLAMAQSDWAYYAAKGGQPPFVKGNPDLKVLMALHSELLAVVVRADSGLNDLNGLKGRRINLGPAGSGPRTVMTALFTTLNWGMADMGALLDLPMADQAEALCSNKVDAIVYLVPHPNAAVADALSRCATKLLPLEGRVIDQLTANNPFYQATTIASGTYPTQTADVPTFGVRALLLSTKKVSDEAAFAIAKTVFGHVAELNALHPSLAKLTAKDLRPEGFGIPVHPGVAKALTAAEPAKAPKAP